MSAVEKFPILLLEAEEESSAVPPCFSHEGINVGLPPVSYLLYHSTAEQKEKLVSLYPTQ